MWRFVDFFLSFLCFLVSITIAGMIANSVPGWMENRVSGGVAVAAVIALTTLSIISLVDGIQSLRVPAYEQKPRRRKTATKERDKQRERAAKLPRRPTTSSKRRRGRKRAM